MFNYVPFIPFVIYIAFTPNYSLEKNNVIVKTVQSPDVSRQSVTLIAKKDNSNLDHVNSFLASGVRELVYFANPKGWTCC